MNKIPAPTSNNYSNYDSYPYGESLRQSMTGDGQDGGYSSFGVRGQSSDVQSYIQYMHRYEQMLMSYRQVHHDPQSMALVDKYLATSQQYLQQVGDMGSMDDLGGSFGADGYGMSGMDPSNGLGASNGTPAPQYGEMIWQDQTRVKWDGTDPVVYPVNQQSESRQQDFFQSDVTIQNPHHGATGKAELVADDSVAAPAKMLKVTFTGTDGSTKVVCVHNVTDKSNIKIQSADQSNIHLDASLTSSPLASQVTVEDLSDDSSNPTVDQGTPPDPNTKNQWTKNRSVDITATEGKDTFTVKSHDLNLSLLDYSQNAYITKVGEGKYVIEVRNDEGKLIRRIEANTKQINLLNTDSDKVFYKDATVKKGSASPSKVGVSSKVKVSGLDALAGDFSTGDGKPTGFEAWSGQDTQITVDGEGSEVPTGGQAVNSKYQDTDTKADNITGNKATYNSSTDVEIHAVGKTMEYDIHAPGNITLHGTSYSDTMEIEKYDAATHTWTIKSYKDGIRDAAHTETFTIHGSAKTKVTLDVMDKNSLVDKDGNVETDPAKLGSVQIGSSGSTSTDDKASKIISSLEAAAGNKTDDQLLSALNAAGFSYAKIDDLKAAMNATPPSFPPAFSTDPGSDFNKLINALYALDGTLSGALNSLKDTWDGNTANSGYSTGTNELVKLLQKLYPEHNISMTYPTGDWGKRDVITFDTVNFHYASYFDGGDGGRHSTFEGIKLSPAS